MSRRFNLKRVPLVFLLLVSVNILIIVPPTYAVDWSPDMRITWNAADDTSPSLAQAEDGRMWFVWHSYRTGDYEIFYKIYNSTAANPWSRDVQLTDSPDFDIGPSIMHASDSRTWVAWASKRTTVFGIYYKIYDGLSWTTDMNLTNNLDDYTPVLMQTANGVIWVFWSSKRTSPQRIFYKTSSDNGASWSGDMQVPSASSFGEKDPFVTQSTDGKIWLVFERDWGIFYKTSVDGISWSAEGTITQSSPNYVNMHPSITQAANGNMWVVWDSDRINDPYGAPQNDIFYRIYDGSSWGPEMQFTTNPLEDSMPSIMRANDGALWVTWSAMRGGLSDIYYVTTSLPLPHDVAVFCVEAFKSIVALGHAVSIEVVAQNHGTNTETFSINLYANTTLIGTRQIIGLIPGELYPMVFNWNTSGAALGNYTLTANASIVAGETNTADNTYVDGIVSVVVHDIAVLSVTPTSTWMYEGYTYSLVIYSEVKNEGTIGENVTVTAYYSRFVIGIMTVPIEPGSILTLLFFFDPVGVQYGDHIISVEATPVRDEDHQADNYLAGGTVFVTIAGDVNHDRTVDILDVSSVSAHWYPGPPEGPLGYDLSFDINEDGAVDILEVAILSAHWDESW